MEERIISALVGLVGASFNNLKTINTDKIIIDSLVFILHNPGFNEDELTAALERIEKEKEKIAPMCAVCQSPCGNTSNYDIQKLYQNSEEIRNLKIKVISQIERLAELIKNVQMDIDIIYKAISYYSYDLDKKSYLELLDEINNKILELEGNNEKANNKH